MLLPLSIAIPIPTDFSTHRDHDASHPMRLVTNAFVLPASESDANLDLPYQNDRLPFTTATYFQQQVTTAHELVHVDSVIHA